MSRTESPPLRSLWIGLLAALAASGCGEDATDPGRDLAATVSIAFTLEGSSGGFAEVVGMQFVVTRLVGGTVALDTTVSVDPGQVSVDVELRVPLTQRPETVLLRLRAFDAEGVSVFVGGPVEIELGADGNGPPSSIEVQLRAVPTTVIPVSDGQRAAVGVAVPAVVQLLDADGLGIPDVQVSFTTTDGTISPSTVLSDAEGFARTTWTLGTTIGVMRADVSLPEFPGLAATLNATTFTPPQPGTDIVVFNDMNMFDETAMQDPNNQLLVRNLVNFTGTGPRANGTVVWFDRGRSSTCISFGECGTAQNATMIAEIANAGLTVRDILSDTLTTSSLDPALKVVFLWNPTVPFTALEIFALQQFAAEGGRIVFIGEWDGFYGSAGIATENQFLLDMGAQMTNTGGAVDCGYNLLPASSILLGHQITTGLTGLTIACASVIQPGPQDFPIMYDLSNTQALGGVARIAPLGAPPASSASPAERQRAFEAEVRRIESSLGVNGLDRTSGSGVKR